ncbi:alpha/beta hydrolase [Belnapia sp. T6]|uniref:Alpha/beta hydrolase n=1 Tax=Belnapia mucosa TaxID=2804532 RepID=A0ABS1V092_9PROT|nr:alpha/beta hydrolase [Belnapia mucosa]MBL6455129.1 alpha/beta hydrolase [Belnapia mucosa]
MPRLTVNGYEMDYAEAGSGEPLVLIHGSLNDQRYWAPQMEPLGARFRVLAPSLRHYWPERWDGVGDTFKIDQHVEDMAGFIAALGAGPVDVIGHSRGGHIAFRLAERHPALIRRLVLAEPGGELDESLGGASGGSGKQGQAFAEAAALLKAGNTEGAMRRFAEHTGGPGAWERRTATRKAINLDNAHTLLGQIDERRRPYGKAAAESIRVPTLLVNGAQTQPQFTTIIEALARVMPDTSRVVIPNAAHGMSSDNPADFNAAVLNFLA